MKREEILQQLNSRYFEFFSNVSYAVSSNNQAKLGETKQDDDKTISQIFEECVEDNAERVALSFKSREMTYVELNSKANQLANYLRSCGVGRNTIVAIYLERSMEFVISVLGIIKAGGMFLPLSMEDPVNRIRRTLQDSNPTKIITMTYLKNTMDESLPQARNANILCIDQFFDKAVETNDQNPLCINEPSDPLYIMYTSGSTEYPKGCVIAHHSVPRVVKNTNYIKIDKTDTMAQVANSAFDAIIFEIFGALLNGAKLQIIPKVTLLSPEDFVKAIRESKSSILMLTASLFNLVLKAYPEAFDNLKYIFSVGEKANSHYMAELLQRKLALNLPLNIINGYGPTECTVFATTFLVERIEDIEQNVPIGKAITDTTLYVLDENLKRVSQGTTGELCIGGKGVALGYLNDPRKMTEKFINNPYNTEEKIYRTGDLVYELTNGNFVYVGRNDSQLKVNGSRIELQEVEATISKNRMIQQAELDVETDETGRKKIVAYVLFAKKENDNFEKFYQYLKENIPPYMIPAKTIVVDRFPLTSNGKLDKRQLTKINRKQLTNKIHYIPTNLVEKLLINIWKELLELTSIDIMQNIFDLGAHSLMLSEACTLINKRLNTEDLVTITDILAYPSINKLSQYITEKNKKETFDDAMRRAVLRKQILKTVNKNNAGSRLLKAKAGIAESKHLHAVLER